MKNKISFIGMFLIFLSACAPTQTYIPTSVSTEISTSAIIFTSSPIFTPTVPPTSTLTLTPTLAPPEPIGLNNINRLQPVTYLNSEQNWTDLRDIAFSPNGKYLAIASLPKLELWDWQGNQLVKTINGWTDSVSFSPDNRYLAFTQAVGMHDIVPPQVLDITTGEIIRSHSTVASVITFSPDGKTYAAAGTKLQIYNTQDGSTVKTIDLATSVCSLSYSPDGMYLAVGMWSAPQIRIYRTTDWKLEKLISLSMYRTANSNKNFPNLKTLEMEILKVSFSPDGKYLAAISNRLNKTIVLVNAKDWQVAKTITSIGADNFHLAFTQDGKLVTDGYAFYNAETGEIALPIVDKENPSNCSGIIISPDGTLMAGGFDQVSVWKTLNNANTPFGWNFNLNDNGWGSNNSMLKVRGGNLVATEWYTDSWVASPHFAVDAIQFTKIAIRMKLSSNGIAGFNWVYQLPEGELQDSPDKRKQFEVIGDGDFHTYILDMAAMPTWRGKIIQLVFGAPSAFEIDYIYLIEDNWIAPPTSTATIAPTVTPTSVSTLTPTLVPTVSADILANPGFEQNNGWINKPGDPNITGDYSKDWASEGIQSYKIALHGDQGCNYYFNAGVRGNVFQKVDLSNVKEILFDLNLTPEGVWVGSKIGAVQAALFVDGVQIYTYQGKGGVEKNQSILLDGKYQSQHTLTFSMIIMSSFCSYGSSATDSNAMYIDNIRFIYK